VNLANDLPLVKVDGSVLLQVFTNLINNSLKYTPPGTPIKISAIRRTNELVVTVADHGPGIPAGEEKKIFEKFYRLAGAENQKGTGLGLTICHSIVEAHGGKIWADNLPAGGAAFHFTLPLNDSHLIEREK
jgi:two-component system sensor histidine kinase KdpD